jgi:hypothetical protein
VSLSKRIAMATDNNGMLNQTIDFMNLGLNDTAFLQH